MFTVNISHPFEYSIENIHRLKQVILATVDDIQELANNTTVEIFASKEKSDCLLHNTIDIEIVVSCKTLMQLLEHHSPIKANMEKAIGVEFQGAQVLCHLISRDPDIEVLHSSGEYVSCK